MQLGSRWPAGSTPPATLPEEFVEKIIEAERASGRSADQMWTLTWLEGSPRAELDDGTLITENDRNQPNHEQSMESETW